MIAAGAAAVVLALVVAGFATVVLAAGPPAEASETTLEPVNTAQANPFLPQAGGADTPGVAPPSDAAGPVGGHTPGLFGGSGSNTCRRDGMADFLALNPDVGAAWAQVQGIEPSQIADFLAHLSPVVLRADTAVTNYGYAGGHLTSRTAVLQSGTAVLVDGYGTPRVKCYCGNPLTEPPRNLSLRFRGTAWPTFAQHTIVVVQPAPVLVDDLTVVDVATNAIHVIDPPPWRYGHAPSVGASGTSTVGTTTTTGPSTSTTTTSTTDPATTTAPTTTAPTTTAPTTAPATTAPTTTAPTTTAPTTTAPTTATTSASPRRTATSPARSSSQAPGSSPTPG